MILAKTHVLVRCRQRMTLPWLAWGAQLAWHQGFMPMVCCNVPRQDHLLQEPQFISTTVAAHLSPLSLCWRWELSRPPSLERSCLGTGEFPGGTSHAGPRTELHGATSILLVLLCHEGSGIYSVSSQGCIFLCSALP